MIWWIYTTIEDNKININGIDSRVVVPHEECGIIFGELFKYAFDLSKKSFSNIVFKDKDKEILTTDIKLPVKDEVSNLNDLRHTIKSYRYILSVFLSTGILCELKTIGEIIRFELIKKDISSRADTLEYFLLNNPNRVRNNRSYYDGRLELDFYKLIQEMYLLAIDGNDKCRWMLAFNTPLQIWFIATMQYVYLLCTVPSLINNRQYYKKTIEYEKKTHQNYLEIIKQSENISSFYMYKALSYTIFQLMIESGSRIPTYYGNYIKSIKKQAYALDKSADCLRF